MNYEKIINNLAISLAQKEIDIAQLKAQIDELQEQLKKEDAE